MGVRFELQTKKCDIDGDEVRQVFGDAKAETIEAGKEVLEHLFQAVLQVQSVTLKDGLHATITSYFEPRVDDEGELHCGIDVNFSDGSHLEFTLANTGWGASRRYLG